MAGPIDPRLLRRARATRNYLVAGLAVGGLTAVLTITQAWLIAHSVADIFATATLDSLGWAMAGLAGVFATKAALVWINEWLAHRSAVKVKSQLRRDIIAARLQRPLATPGSGGLVTLITQGLDSLDGYFAKYLPQLLLAVTVPAIIGVAVLTQDLTSAVILALTLPLIPVFMALVGWTTESITKRRWAVQTRLANHFADLIAGLPTLQVFGRARAQAKGLLRSETAHRHETMRTLRVSFLSALVLELLATLSVAVIAVTVGFRVVFGELDLATALFLLILAPEAYLPVRQVGVHYHDAADGIAAVDSAFALIDAGAEAHHRPATEPVSDSNPKLTGPAALLSVHDLSYTYPGSDTPALEPVGFEVRPGQIVALAGASGAGKTTLVNLVLGFLTPQTGTVLWSGHPATGDWRHRIAYVGQHPGLLAGTVADNVRLGFPQASDAAIREALDQVGAARIPLDQLVADDAEGVSAGERRRIAVARALLRVTLGRARLLVLDEPTAGLDTDTEAEMLANLRRVQVATLVVSHRPAVLEEADQVVRIGPEPVPASVWHHTPAVAAEPALTVTSQLVDPSLLQDPSDPAPAAPLLRRLFDAVPGARWRLSLAVILAFAATGATVALMGISAWLLSFAATMPPILYLEAPAVGVRFFGISRGAFRYTERLVGHDVALRLQSALRLETYSRLARTTLLGRRLGDLLARVIADVEAIQDLVVRVWIPFLSSTAVVLVTALAISFFSPGSALVLLGTSLLAALVVPWLSRVGSARADAAALGLRGEMSDAAREISRNAPDLVAYQASDAQLERFVALDAQLTDTAARSTRVRGAGSALQVLAAGAAVVGALVIAGGQVASGTLEPTFLAVAVLIPLALHEALSSLILSAQTATRARTALRRVEELLDADPVGVGDLVDPGVVVDAPSVQVTGLAAGWPGHPSVVTNLNFSVAAGEKVALVGPSGVGKTTVAATILGLIPAQSGSVAVNGRVGYLAQDAHLFTTSVAENVKIGNRDASEEEIRWALARAGLDLEPSRLVGETGQGLSGGESRRLALSRLLVGHYQVLLLDEPTEHLDAATADALIRDIWADTATSPVLVITHDPALVARCDRVVTLS